MFKMFVTVNSINVSHLLSANDIYWSIRLEHSSSNVENPFVTNV